MMSTNTMTGPTNDVDFSFGAMQAAAAQPYAGFDAAGAMAAMPSVERPPPLLQHHHHNSHLYDSFDLAAAGFPFQEPGLLPPASLPLPPSMELAAMPPSPLQMPLPGLLAAAEVYPFGGAAAFLKREDGGHHHQLVDAGGGGTSGLNLGRRTYFSPADVLAVDRLLTRSRLGVGVLGLGLGAAQHHHHHQQPPRCQAEGCKADLSAAKHYHRRHKVCEYHAKAAAVAAAGKQQRFCQQCSRYARIPVPCMHRIPCARPRSIDQVFRWPRDVNTRVPRFGRRPSHTDTVVACACQRVVPPRPATVDCRDTCTFIFSLSSHRRFDDSSHNGW